MNLELECGQLNKMWDSFPMLKNDLLRVQSKLKENIDIPNEKINKQVLQTINSSAKLLRPALMIILGKTLTNGAELSESFIGMAATLELVHMASLVHDDVVDKSDIRRELPTLYSTDGSKIAVYTGDFMLSQAYINTATYAQDKDYILFISKVIQEILSGELLQLKNIGNISVSENQYLEAIKRKTANLLGLSCHLAGKMLNYNSPMELWEMGINIGIAFQIIDDILDITDNNNIKSTHNDFKEGIFTLPIIYATKEYKNKLAELYSKASTSKIKEEQDSINNELDNILKCCDAINYAKKVAKEYTKSAYRLAEKLPQNQYSEILKEIISILLDRSL